MTTPTDPPHEDAPVDGRVHALLWRLRARLVVPPDAQRVDHDLDRILAAAAQLRHAQPEAHLEGSRGAQGEGEQDATAEAARGPNPNSLTPEPVRLPRVESLAARREAKLPYGMGRVAAVAVLIVGVAGGLATAMDRDGTILALLGADSRVPVDVVEAPTAGGDAEVPDRDAALDTSDGSSSPSDGDPSDGDDADAGTTPGSSVEAAEDPADGEEPDAGSTSDEASDERGERDGTEQDGTGGSERSPEPQEEPRETVEEVEEIDETVTAMPADPGELDGFGGPAPCPEDSLRDCVTEDEEGSVEEPPVETADEDDEGEDDGDVDDEDERDPFKELAGRRYKP